jgi:hypothetical protein
LAVVFSTENVDFAAESAVQPSLKFNHLGTEYDLESDLQKMRNQGTCSFRPSTGIVRKSRLTIPR